MPVEHRAVGGAINCRGPLLNRVSGITHSGEDRLKGLHVCTVSGEVEGILSIADALSGLPPHKRTDFGFIEAPTALRDEFAEQAPDILIIAMGEDIDVLPAMAQECVDAATRSGVPLFVLASSAVAGALTLPPSALVISPSEAATLAEHLPQGMLSGDTDKAVSTPQTALASHDSDETATTGLRARIARLLGMQRVRNGKRKERSILNEVIARRSGVIAIQGVSGGVGATTLATNLAVELAEQRGVPGVCLLDLNLQFGSVASHLAIEETDQIRDAYQSIQMLDAEGFEECLRSYGRKLRVFSGPPEVLPCDALTGADAARLIGLAKKCAPLVIVDLPHMVMDWSGEVYKTADVSVCVAQQDVRSVRNARKLQKLFSESEMDTSRFVHALNRCPIEQDEEWQDRLTHFETGLGCKVSHFFAEGGAEVAEACDMGQPLARYAPGNAFRKSLLRFIGEFTQSKAVSNV